MSRKLPRPCWRWSPPCFCSECPGATRRKAADPGRVAPRRTMLPESPWDARVAQIGRRTARPLRLHREATAAGLTSSIAARARGREACRPSARLARRSDWRAYPMAALGEGVRRPRLSSHARAGLPRLEEVQPGARPELYNNCLASMNILSADRHRAAARSGARRERQIRACSRGRAPTRQPAAHLHEKA